MITTYLTVQSYHWNVEGIDFTQYHDVFGGIYEQYYGHVDRIAEYIRVVSASAEYAVGNIDVVASNKTVMTEVIVGSKTKQMIESTITLNGVLLNHYSELYTLAEEAKLVGLSDYCASTIDELSKLNWKLKAMTK